MRRMGIFKEPPKRETQLKVLMTPEEKAALDAAADRMGMTTSRLVRAAINEYVERHDKSGRRRKNGS